MASKIRILSEHTINKIAAGEVIENPASVVKELVENSLDAGSNDICVEIKEGGRQLIRITDNGCGMNHDDAILCLERHATSKIRNVEDIHDISTMGFRGEAIPSIASISKFTLLTCPSPEPGQEPATEGTLIIVDGGKILQCTSAACSPGTTIEIKNLFFNVPVRKKFQKSPTYDATEILKVLTTLSLGHPTIKFQLISDHKTILSTPVILREASAQNLFLAHLKMRIESVLGDDFKSNMSAVDERREDLRLQGYIGLPTFTKTNRTGQHLYINNRAVVSPTVSFAVRDGYGSALQPGRHPVFVLHLAMPGELVDVNVHPQKKEVRLRQEQHIKEMVIASIHMAFQSTQGQAAWSVPCDIDSNRSEELFTTPIFAKEEDHYINTTKPFSSFSLPPLSEFLPWENEVVPTIVQEKVEEKQLPLVEVARPVERIPQVLATIKNYILLEGFWSNAQDQVQDHQLQLPKEGLWFVDQRGAHARVLFEQFKRQNHASLEKAAIQTLLIPYTFTTTPFESALLTDCVDQLNKLGISIHQSGPHLFLIDAIPTMFGNSDLQTLVSDLLYSLRDLRDSNLFLKEYEKHLACAASRAAISAQKKLSALEAQTLIKQLVSCDNPYQCPQGKPVIFQFSNEEISKKFLK